MGNFGRHALRRLVKLMYIRSVVWEVPSTWFGSQARMTDVFDIG